MAGAVMARRGRRNGRRGRRSMSEINVTPFVDVMLVLLIIFMVAAPLLTTGVPLELPKTTADALPTPSEEPLTIQLASDGKVYVMDTEVSRDTLVAQLTAIGRERSDDQVFLRADAGLDYGSVMQVMGALNAAGFSSIALVTDPARAAAPAEGETRTE